MTAQTDLLSDVISGLTAADSGTAKAESAQAKPAKAGTPESWRSWLPHAASGAIVAVLSISLGATFGHRLAARDLTVAQQEVANLRQELQTRTVALSSLSDQVQQIQTQLQSAPPLATGLQKQMQQLQAQVQTLAPLQGTVQDLQKQVQRLQQPPAGQTAKPAPQVPKKTRR
ncbi:MAG TPA: hypothetical protein VEB64_17015 [Azospirillaceae bacterium]|nr:hypothetical protein [Azospirillaceae bacterium]